MADVTLAIVSGTLRASPELRFTERGTALASALVEATRTNPDGSSSKSTWRVVFWGEAAERFSTDIQGGARVLVAGSLRNRKVERDGRTEWQTEIHGSAYEPLTVGPPI